MGLQGLCCRPPRRTALAEGAPEVRHAGPPVFSRVNGWSRPIHPLQLVHWAAFLFVGAVTFGTFLPLLPGGWKVFGYSAAGGLFLLHLVSYLAAVSLDPADPSVRVGKDYAQPMPFFNRAGHPHVIDNQYCLLCEVAVSPKAKHCSACNKCIAGFDHHCKWLNNCVGSRNYWSFFISVASAFACLLGLALVILYTIIQYLVDPSPLRTDAHYAGVDSSMWLLFPQLLPTKMTGMVLLTISVSMLLLDCVGLLLLGHLFFFHLFLMVKRMSTFEFITRGRERQTPKGTGRNKGPPDPKGQPPQQTKSPPHSPAPGGKPQKSRGPSRRPSQSSSGALHSGGSSSLEALSTLPSEDLGGQLCSPPALSCPGPAAAVLRGAPPGFGRPWRFRPGPSAGRRPPRARVARHDRARGSVELGDLAAAPGAGLRRPRGSKLTLRAHSAPALPVAESRHREATCPAGGGRAGHQDSAPGTQGPQLALSLSQKLCQALPERLGQLLQHHSQKVLPLRPPDTPPGSPGAESTTIYIMEESESSSGELSGEESGLQETHPLQHKLPQPSKEAAVCIPAPNRQAAADPSAQGDTVIDMAWALGPADKVAPPRRQPFGLERLLCCSP
ncbi:probable palmitoyltransferase ZDHHC11B [Talpa occidentalis]|uniref:probable palmitoyltransferase ZDHHC11B n=1 Tax=Talpa occidentalis TaxID=50954 RepID=UPI0023F7FCCC|nr:probable palmitoyltransferase ZDHHC11B [Talpa occidentalis]